MERLDDPDYNNPRYGVVPIPSEYGRVHDRGLCAVVALLAAATVSRELIGRQMDPLNPFAIGLYLGASIVGYGIGKATPPEFRGVLQVASTTALTLIGVGTYSAYGGY